MSQALLDAIVDKGPEWKDLDLDFYSLPVDTLKKILDKATHVQRVKVLLDAPFKSLVRPSARLPSRKTQPPSAAPPLELLRPVSDRKSVV